MSQTQPPLTNSERAELDDLRQRIAELERVCAQREPSTPYQRQFALAVEQSSNSVVITDLDGTIQYVNPRFTQLTGYTAEEVVGQNPRIMQSGLTPREVFEDLWHTLEAGRVWRGNFTNRKKNGDLYYEEATIFPAFDEQGQPTHYVAIKENITLRKLAEETLKINQANLQVFQARLMALHRVNARLSTIRDLDELYRQTIVLGRDELGFDRMGLLLLSDDGREFLGTFGTDEQGNLRDERGFRASIESDAHIREARNNRDSATAWNPKPLIDFGRHVGEGWGIIAPLWDEEHALGWLAVDNLVSRVPMKPYEVELLTLYGLTLAHLVKRLRSEQALSESNRIMRAMLQANPDTFVRMSADGTFIEIKPGLSMRDIVREDLVIGKNTRELLSAAAAANLLATIRQAIATGEMQTTEYTDEFPDGRHVFEVRVVSLTPDEVLSVARDITEQRDAMERSVELAVQQERVRLLANFITKASHEFRTPLSVIGVNTYLAEKTTDPTRRVEALRAIQDQAETLNQLVEGLLTVMRLDAIESLSEHPVNLVHMLNDVLRKANAKGKVAGLIIESHLATELPPVRGDITRLAHALDHLLDNALRFTPSGGRITLRSALVDQSIVIEMSDTGIGIGPDQMAHIFEQFYRADPSQTTRGLGLGLPIAQRIIHLHGGRIEVESARGEGATFRVILPAYTTQ